MAGYDIYGNNIGANGGYGTVNYGVPNPNNITQGYYPRPVPSQQFMPIIYVHGRAGAEAYQLPQNITRQLLWDDEDDRFYIKAIDEYGRPKIIADNDFFPHVEKDKPAVDNNQIDFSVYPTRKDIEEFLNKYDTSKYLTKQDLDDALSHLTLGAQGRIVRNESDA